MPDRGAYYQAHPEQREKARERAREWRQKNKERHAANTKAWREANPERQKQLIADFHERNPKYQQTHPYGIVEQEYQTMLAAQEGHCYFCSRTTADDRGRRLVVDHDHVTGRARGLLCFGCNISLGYFERGQRSRLPEERTRVYLGITERPPPSGGGPAD